MKLRPALLAFALFACGKYTPQVCPPEAELVYVVDSSKTFSSFNPATLSFLPVGQLLCPAQGEARPFSMSVDQYGKAWVLYDNGELFKVDTKHLQCTRALFEPDATMLHFGMGFASDGKGAATETLYIAGGLDSSASASTFATLTNLEGTVTLSKRGQVPGWPELTGTGDGDLWGFFPDATSPKVAQIDKATGKEGKTFSVSGIRGTPEAWAFAHWGGDFWIFLKRPTDASTAVHRLHAKDGFLDTPLPNTGRRIVGAGVSVCAPTVMGADASVGDGSADAGAGDGGS